MRTVPRSFVFTLNNYSEADVERFRSMTNVRYFVAGREIAPTTGIPHLQGYCELSNVMRLNTLQHKFSGIHVEPRRGTQQQAIDYCKKGGDVIEFGTPKQKGRRNDVVALRQYFDRFMSEYIDSPECNLVVLRILEKYKPFKGPVRTWKTKVLGVMVDLAQVSLGFALRLFLMFIGKMILKWMDVNMSTEMTSVNRQK